MKWYNGTVTNQNQGFIGNPNGNVINKSIDPSFQSFNGLAPMPMIPKSHNVNQSGSQNSSKRVNDDDMIDDASPPSYQEINERENGKEKSGNRSKSHKKRNEFVKNSDSDSD